MVFDRIVIQFMDSFVWCFLLLVSANCMIRITTAHHEKVLVEVQSTSSTENLISPASPADESTTEAKEKIASTTAQSRNIKVSSQGKSQLLENIFNIPIATLRAVNDLVQSIVSTVHSAGGAGGDIDPRSIKETAGTTEKSKQ